MQSLPPVVETEVTSSSNPPRVTEASPDNLAEKLSTAWSHRPVDNSKLWEGFRFRTKIRLAIVVGLTGLVFLPALCCVGVTSVLELFRNMPTARWERPKPPPKPFDLAKVKDAHAIIRMAHSKYAHESNYIGLMPNLDPDEYGLVEIPGMCGYSGLIKSTATMRFREGQDPEWTLLKLVARDQEIYRDPSYQE